MRLKSIKLAGFKSFVDPTKVNLLGNLCAVVGPNGCGKSNIIDAVRWVMGESSAKNLRGESSTDVIFNGSTSRQPLGQATIELVFDNHDRTLAGEFAGYNEVSIRRKVTREGQSTYYLNGQKCRRRDVTDLFLGTGLGPRSYSIIEQGMISRLIESRPDELRVYIEEVAGISRYKERRRDTSNRISRSRENLSRLKDIREELGRQLETLKQQAKTAEQYTELKQNERQHRSQLAALQWRELRQKLLLQRVSIGHIEERIILEQSAQDMCLVQMDVHKTDLALLNQNFTQQQGSFYSLGADIARLEQTIEHQQQQQQRWQADVSEAQQQMHRIDEARATDGKELRQLNQQQEQLLLDSELVIEQLFEAETALLTKEAERQQSQQLWQQKSEQQAQLKNTIEVAKAGLQQQQQQAAQVQQDQQASLAELRGISLPKDEDIDLLDAQLKEQQQQQQFLVDQLLSLEHGLKSQRQQELEQQQQLDGQVQTLGVLSGQLASLRLLLSEAEQDAPLIPSVWRADSSQKLIDELQVELGWELAIEHVLQDWLGAHVLAQLPAQYVHPLSDVKGLTLLVPHADAQLTLAIKSGSTLLDKIRTPFGLGGLLGQVHAAKDWPHAQALLATLPIYGSVVLADGLWLGHGWIRTPPREGSKSGLLGRKQQVQSLVTEQQVLLRHQQHTQLLLTQSRARALEAEQAISQLRQSIQLGQSQLQQQQQVRALLQLKSEQGRSQEQSLQQRVEQHSQRLEHLSESMALLHEELSEH